MKSFTFQFSVDAPLATVAHFHRQTGVLARLTPPPLVAQIHRFDPMADGAEAEFTLWFGPLPVRWQAVHEEVSPEHGFTDRQLQGPMAYWRHQHQFSALSPNQTLVTERINYEYRPGWRGWLSRLFFNPLALRGLFAYRRWVTRREIYREGRWAPSEPASLS